jgi:hypothetical protein
VRQDTVHRFALGDHGDPGLGDPPPGPFS